MYINVYMCIFMYICVYLCVYVHIYVYMYPSEGFVCMISKIVISFISKVLNLLPVLYLKLGRVFVLKMRALKREKYIEDISLFNHISNKHVIMKNRRN